MKLKFIIILVVVLVCLTEAMAAILDNKITYGFRWKITETPKSQAVNPPLKILWDKSPVWFEKWGAGGQTETPNRHIAIFSQGLVSVIKRSLYLLDYETGKTLWTLALDGDEICDWVVVDDIFIYTSIDWTNKKSIRSAIDLMAHKKLWIDVLNDDRRAKGLFKEETVTKLPNNSVLFTTNQDDRLFSGPLDIVDPHTGNIILKQEKNIFPESLVPYTWLAFNGRFYAFVANPGYLGLNLKSYNIFDATLLEPLHIYGNDLVGNLFFPTVVDKDGTVFVAYGLKQKVIAFNLTEGKLKWNADLPRDGANKRTPIKSLVLSRSDKCLLATINPNKFIVINPDNGSIVKTGELKEYIGWTDHNAMLLSYPYLYTSARRSVNNSYYYDLLAVNIETDQVEWSFNVGIEKSSGGPATSEILNFIVKGDKVFIARGDAHIMAFQISIKEKN